MPERIGEIPGGSPGHFNNAPGSDNFIKGDMPYATDIVHDCCGWVEDKCNKIQGLKDLLDNRKNCSGNRIREIPEFLDRFILNGIACRIFSCLPYQFTVEKIQLTR